MLEHCMLFCPAHDDNDDNDDDDDDLTARMFVPDWRDII